MATTSITITHNTSSDYKGRATDSTRVVCGKLATFLSALGGGVYQGSEITVSQDAATGTVTLSGVDGVAATGSYALSNVGGANAFNSVTFSGSTGAWTVTIRGVVFTGTSGGNDLVEAAALETAVNASVDPLINGVIFAQDEGGGLVNLFAVAKGTAANAYTLALTGTGLSAAGATFSGGLNGSVGTTINGTLVTTNTTDLSDTDAATAVAAAIEANGTLGPLIAAVDSTNNVNLTWSTKGVVGNAVTLAAGTSTTGTATRSGATLTGGLDNDVTVTIGGVAVVSDTTTLANADAATLVAADINADAGAAALVTASAASNVVTLTAVEAGTGGNGISLTSATTNGTATASGATLSGGSENTYTL